ncbi:MAG: Eco57I restriction-modification methylase domain-containing protein, partial [Bacteroidota bacterium]|nr:Eco57I restriction-modification methylase domain-containing protein [Bacteroidota bacterium]
VLYRNAFEWRFEFPEVLNEKGDFEGFEAIIGNPPYIQLQKMGADADALQNCGYQTFTRTSDIYCLFYEQAQRLLKPGYFFGYITSNKWMRANYGEATRRFLLENTNPLLLVDFGGYQVFESATVDTNMLIAQNAPYTGQTGTCLLDKSLGSLEKMSVFIKQHINVVRDFSKESSWVILSEIEARVKAKIEAKGLPLKDWEVQINYGIKTGFNAAFIIDDNKRQELLKKCPKADSIIRPILRGRDIKKYNAEFADKWLINSHNGDNILDRVNLEQDFPAVYEHLKLYENQLIKRYDKGFHWSNLRNCAYLNELEKPKIIWIELSDIPKFSFDTDRYFVEATAFMMTGDHLKYLTTFLNSKLSDWYFDKITTTSGVGTNRWKKIYIENFPIPTLPPAIEISFDQVLDEISKHRGNIPIIEKLDLQLNLMVLDLYDFSKDEKELILNFSH